jgi:hypothetical protein
MRIIYRVHEGNPRLQYYNNTNAEALKCNEIAFEEFTKHTTKIKLIHPKSKIKDVVEA